jgi:hypothetical protein
MILDTSAEDFRKTNITAGSGVVWNRTSFDLRVIPAKAGIQSVGSVFPMACGVDSRLRGNDCTHECARLANGSTTITTAL